MLKEKINKIELPNYSQSEENINSFSHFLGIILGIIVFFVLLNKSVKINNKIYLFSGIIYGLSIILLYTMSCIYHGLNKNINLKKLFRIFDHCTIYLLIAGTYTPLTLCALYSVNKSMAIIIFIIEWSLAFLAIYLTAKDLKKYEKFSMFCYIVLGWCIFIAIKYVIEALTLSGFLFLLFGGLSYTLGSVLYGIGKKKKYIHCVFHFFVLLGSILHFLCIVLYVY